jgi:hypothetical protein
MEIENKSRSQVESWKNGMRFMEKNPTSDRFENVKNKTAEGSERNNCLED